MFKRSEYHTRLAEIGLEKAQVEKLRRVLDDMMGYAARLSNTPNAAERISAYYDGKADGINAVDRFLRGDMDAHDEFEGE